MTTADSQPNAGARATASRYVRDHDGVLAGLPIRPGIAAASLPLFGESCWNVAPAVFRENTRRCHCSVDFGLLTSPAQHLTAKEYLYARLREPEGSLRPRLAPGSIRAVFNRLRRFMRFAEERSGVFDLGLLQQADLVIDFSSPGAAAAHVAACAAARVPLLLGIGQCGLDQFRELVLQALGHRAHQCSLRSEAMADESVAVARQLADFHQRGPAGALAFDQFERRVDHSLIGQLAPLSLGAAPAWRAS